MITGEIRTDNTKTLMNALERIAGLEKENAELRNKLDGNKQNMAHALGDIRMTDEEMARLYLVEKYGLQKDLEIERIQHSVLSLEFYTYLAGLKAGEKLGFEKGVKVKVNTTTISDCPVKPVWHSVAAGDLPKEKKLYLVTIKDNGLAIAYFNGLHWETKYNLGDFGHCVETVIAWCEIPEYKE